MAGDLTLLYDRLGSMPCAKRRAAMGNVRRAEVLADLFREPRERVACGGLTKSASRIKTVSLALQGGGSHGAFTWGVLDRLLEDERIEFEAISGASAGAVNAIVLADGLTRGGRDGARQALAELWNAVASYATPTSNGFSSLAHYWSPYQLNPLNLNPLRDIIVELVDFERIRSSCKVKLFIAATQVRTAKLRLFRNDELSLEALLASACLPSLHQAVEIDGEPYWDGALSANPAIFPLFYDCESPDVIVVLLHPLRRSELPISSAGISSRMTELSFSAPFLREMRAIALAKDYVEKSHFPYTGLERRLARMNFHLIQAEELMTQLSVESKLDSRSSFLTMLRDHGRAHGEVWLRNNFDLIGERSSIDLHELFC
jgi:NTE family protein